jgi:HEAT repeat protein
VDESKPLDEEELVSLVAELQSTNDMSRAEAARDLVNRRNRIQSPTEEFLKLVASLVEDRNETVRNAAVSMLAEHGTKDHVPLLIRFLPTADQSLRPRIIQGLGRIGDIRAAEPLADLIAVGPVHQFQFNSMREDEVGRALVGVGESAEPTVLPLLNERNAQTRVVACGVLKDIGTHKSIRPLQELTLSPVKEVSEAAAEALRSIHARESR